MIRIMKLPLLGLAIVALILPSASFAGKKEKHNTGKAMDAHMEKMIKLTQPGTAHQQLEKLVGEWNHTVSWRMNPTDEFTTMTGTNKNHMIMGGRFLRQKTEGKAQKNQPKFVGEGTMGFDNIKGEYTSTWIDNMGTGTMTGYASFNPKSKKFNETGTYSCPITGKDRRYRASLVFMGKNKYKYVMYTSDPSTGKEFKSMEIAYTRK